MRHLKSDIRYGLKGEGFRKRLLFLLFSFSFCIFNTYAQEVIPTTGGNATGNGGSASYTVGQICYTIFHGIGGSDTQGVQQAYEISVHTETGDPIGVQLICKAYPNPIIDHLYINVESFKQENLTYQMYDLNGIVFDINEIYNNQASIPVNYLLPGIYYLRIISKGTVVKVFKIIKR